MYHVIQWFSPQRGGFQESGDLFAHQVVQLQLFKPPLLHKIVSIRKHIRYTVFNVVFL
jgi:hypothetical protein